MLWIICCFLLPLLQRVECKPAAVATHIHGTEDDKYCAKTEGEKKKQLEAEERPDMFEGDIMKTGKLDSLIKLSKSNKRDFMSIESMKWKSPVIPYVLDNSLSTRTIDVIKTACDDYAKFTCIKCVLRTTEPDYIRFHVGEGCWSFVGRQGGSQDLSLGSGCDFKGTVIHELLHALGFFHEHTRLDRDDYVTISWDKIKTGMEGNFKKYAVGVAEYLGEPYDYNSIMHYPESAFSKDTSNTITIKNNAGATVGQRLGLSEVDIKQIKKAYKCSDVQTTPAPGAAAVTATTTAAPPPPPPQSVTTPSTPAPPAASPATVAPPTPPSAGGTTKAPTIGTTQAPTIGTTQAPAGGSTEPATTTPQPQVTTTEAPVTNPIILGPAGKIMIKIKTAVLPQGQYPMWPQDFNWNTNGVPQTCNCQSCNCQCVHVNEPAAGTEWKTNYICYKKSEINPGMEWSYNGPVPNKRCTHISDPTFGKYWDNNFLCVPKESPYHFIWSFRGPLKAEKVSCIRMGIPGGPREWRDNYLCAKKIQNDS